MTAVAAPLAFFAQGDPAAAATGFWSIVFSGGVTGALILIVLLGLSIAAAYLVFDQTMTLRRREILPDGLAETVRHALQRGSVDEAVDPQWDAGVDHGVQQELADLERRHAVCERALDVDPQLVRATHRTERGERDHAALAARQAFS